MVREVASEALILILLELGSRKLTMLIYCELAGTGPIASANDQSPSGEANSPAWGVRAQCWF